ncbi:ABC transporter permease [Roseateles saccharophilus]|uniref:Sodium transport system permease protein n=1 Tax=Roseateles saccharophilus TaxID=304 RepID=A0A4R3UNK6_ROSSA|nr:ABC transporter permease subunit [Roseateles saccharophilus]MDG0834258.1 ABC transporter permease [Roseateles saccharophilus]TCU91868.1 sodium transport system permease protein [Roseateles saccharophilus]
MKQALIVFVKELSDALRDRRTLLRLLIPAVLMGPLLLTALSGLIASLEERADKREVLVVGMDAAPTLANYIERQTYTMKPAPADYEARLRATTLLEPVLVVPKDFEAKLRTGEAPTVEIVSDSANQRAMAGTGPLRGLLLGFSHERAMLNLAMRGVSTELLEPVDVQERDLASAQARAARLTSIIPMFIIMAVLYGALTAALDSTAGERERGSLEPLLMNPAPHGAIVAGKWGAVALLGMAVALMSSLSFIPAQWLLKSDVLQAQFSFGGPEVLAFWLLQIPLAAGLSALLMALAIRSKTFKEAQASSTLVITAVSLMPMVSLFNPGGDAPWYLWVPGLAQNTLMLQVLKGEALRWAQVLPGVLVGFALAAVALAYVARSMRAAVAR